VHFALFTMPIMEKYLVTTFFNVGESSNATLRVKPLSGQGLPDDMRVECSRAMRRAHVVGTIFEIKAKLTNREGGKPFLVAPWNAPYNILSKEEAKSFIKRHYP
jgi:hypothetical protein